MANELNMTVVRNAKVETKVSTDSNGFLTLSLIIEDKYVHTFSGSSRESRMIEITESKVLESFFNGGTYVFVDGKLQDYRSSQYRGHIQSDDALSALADIIGIEKFDKSKYSDPVRGLYNQIRGKRNNDVFLGGTWDKFDLDVKSLGTGGAFENQLVYRYSPFSDKIQTSFEVNRLVCENGMTANSPFVTFEVPVIDDWENNLQVISAQLKPKVNDILHRRFEEMADPKSRASVYDVERANKIIQSRILTTVGETNPESKKSIERLARLEGLTDINYNLGKVYKESSLNDNKAKKRMDSHLTQFDVFNIFTEMTSHTVRNEESDFVANSETNRIVFDNFKNKKKIVPKLPISQDSDHRRIFFGSDDK